MEDKVAEEKSESRGEDAELARHGSNLADLSEVKTILQLAQYDQDVEDDLLEASLEKYQ